MSAGSLTLGGNMSIALGPLGRNGEASGSLNTSGKVAAMSVNEPNFVTHESPNFSTGTAIRRLVASLEGFP